VKPSDLALVRTPGPVSLSPDGRQAVVSVSRIDLEEDTYRAGLWLLDTSGETPPRKLTEGRHRDVAPAWSPDGRFIAFVRAEIPDGKPRILVLPVDGGEPRAVTTDEHHPIGAGAPRWSPDSTRLAYTARVPEQGRYGTDEKLSPDKEAPRRITTLRYRLDGVGFTIDRRSHVFVLDPHADEPAPAQVTDGDVDDDDVTWTPDGALLFASARDVDVDVSLFNDLYTCAADGSGLRRITRGADSCQSPGLSPDGGTVFYLGYDDVGAEGRDFAGRNPVLRAVPFDGSAPPVTLSDAETLAVDSPGPSLVVGKDGVLLLAYVRGQQQLLRVPLTGGDPEVVMGGDRTVVAADTAGGLVVATVGTGDSAGEVVVAGEEERVLTSFGTALTEQGDLRPLEPIEATAPDGYVSHGWIVRPDPERFPGPRPVLLDIHGGPFAQYGWLMFDEAQVYAAAGYLVILGNPRGALGYGSAHGRAIKDKMGTVDADDLLAMLDTVLEDEQADRSRVGIMGGSYGGFMTTWLAGHTEGRFRAAIVERAVTAFDSFTGSSDIGSFFTEGYAGTDPKAVAEQSPLTYADRITIPTLIIHSEQDWRCPLEQAQRLFVALRQNGTPAEMLVFPGEGHELSRSGLPSHRVARFEAILGWWSEHLA
jgi:dipeptidyl aminopeptidase/acylaminoacyl peptidase